MSRIEVGDLVVIKKPSRRHHRDVVFRVACETRERSLRGRTVYPIFELQPLETYKRMEKWTPWIPSWNLEKINPLKSLAMQVK